MAGLDGEDQILAITTKINDTNNNINATIVDLDAKLDSVLEKNEKDFLMAYRFHMLKVQNELMNLRKKASEQELKAVQDNKLADLDKKAQIIQDQCMDYRKHCDEQETLIKKLNFEKQIMIDDSEFLDF